MAPERLMVVMGTCAVRGGGMIGVNRWLWALEKKKLQIADVPKALSTREEQWRNGCCSGLPLRDHAAF